MAPAPEALRPSLPSLFPAGGARKRVVRENTPAAAKHGNSVGTLLHTAVLGQEAGCNLLKNGEGGDSNVSCLLGSDGSNSPRSPWSINSAPPLFTQPVVPDNKPSCGRPNRMGHRNRPPEGIRVRSGEVKPSVAADRETEFESISIAAGEVSAPPLADQPKLGKHYDQMISARRLSGRGMRRPKRVWCWPGKGTPRGARVKQDPAKTCRKHGCWFT